MMASEWVSIPEAATRLGVSPDTIRRRMKRGELVSRKESRAQGYVWQIEVESAPAESEPRTGEQSGHTGDAFELERLRERVAGLERERSELIEQHNAWQDQAHRSSEAEAQLRELVARAQMLAQALPAETSTVGPGGTFAAPQQDSVPLVSQQRTSLWARLFGRSANS